MKRIFLISSFFFSVVMQQTSAQGFYGNVPNQPVEISIGYGTPSIVTLIEGVNTGEDGYNSRQINTYTGTFSCTIRYAISRRFSVGVGIAYENETGDMQIYVNSSNTGAITANQGTFKRNVFTMAPEALLHYTSGRNTWISAYGYLGIGFSFLNELDNYSESYVNGSYNYGMYRLGNKQDNHTEETMQICPIGLSFGGRFRGFAELGFGYKGIVNGGLSVKL